MAINRSNQTWPSDVTHTLRCSICDGHDVDCHICLTPKGDTGIISSLDRLVAKLQTNYNPNWQNERARKAEPADEQERRTR